MSASFDSPRTQNLQVQPTASQFELTGFRPQPQQMSVTNAFNDSDGNRSLLIDINDHTDDCYNLMEDSALTAPLMSKRM